MTSTFLSLIVRRRFVFWTLCPTCASKVLGTDRANKVWYVQKLTLALWGGEGTAKYLAVFFSALILGLPMKMEFSCVTSEWWIYSVIAGLYYKNSMMRKSSRRQRTGHCYFSWFRYGSLYFCITWSTKLHITLRITWSTEGTLLAAILLIELSFRMRRSGRKHGTERLATSVSLPLTNWRNSGRGSIGWTPAYVAFWSGVPIESGLVHGIDPALCGIKCS
jgi:hypothetical protein